MSKARLIYAAGYLVQLYLEIILVQVCKRNAVCSSVSLFMKIMRIECSSKLMIGCALHESEVEVVMGKQINI